MNPYFIEYLKQEIWRAQLTPSSLTIYSESHAKIMTMDESMSGYEDIRLHILQTMVNSKGDVGWEQYDRIEDEIKIHQWADTQVKSDKRFREGSVS